MSADQLLAGHCTTNSIYIYIYILREVQHLFSWILIHREKSTQLLFGGPYSFSNMSNLHVHL